MKYPRTYHLPWSPGGTNDDKRMSDLSSLLKKKLVVTEKMDGSNVCLEARGVFARSHNGPPKHPSFDMLKALYYQIPPGVLIFGEWLYAKHSIQYFNLPNYLMIFGILSNNRWLSWKDVELWAQKLGVSTVPVITKFTLQRVERLEILLDREWQGYIPTYGPVSEGYVIRPYMSFSNNDFSKLVGKWVRKNHVQTDEHWKYHRIVKNRLKKL